MCMTDIVDDGLDMVRTYEDRLVTFLNWSYPVSPEELAAAGFYYTKTSDIVRCVYCFCEFNNWKEGDDPLEDHYKYAKHCDLAKILWKCRNFNKKVVKTQDKKSVKVQVGCSSFSLIIAVLAFTCMIFPINEVFKVLKKDYIC